MKKEKGESLLSSSSSAKADDAMPALPDVPKQAEIVDEGRELKEIRRALNEREAELHFIADKLREKEASLNEREEDLKRKEAAALKIDAMVSEKMAIIRAAADPDDNEPIVRALRITGPSDGYRRAGLKLSREPQDVPASTLSVDQILALRADPRLKVVEVLL
jgi:DNA-binding transcriptional MerR regulator